MGHSEGKAQDNALAKEIATAVQNVDTFLSNIVTCCCVTLMPGEHDPTNVMLPQRPLHPCLLPKTSRYYNSYKKIDICIIIIINALLKNSCQIHKTVHFYVLDIKVSKALRIHGSEK